MQPDVVIVCPGAERLWDVHLLTMLSLDPEVSDILVCTCDIDRENQHCDCPALDLIGDAGCVLPALCPDELAQHLRVHHQCHAA